MSKYPIRTLVKRLESETILTLVVAIDGAENVKKKLSQAKHRMGIEGKLCFSITEPNAEGFVELTVSLLPPSGGPIKDVYSPLNS